LCTGSPSDQLTEAVGSSCGPLEGLAQ
jgi:hypothetical protein